MENYFAIDTDIYENEELKHFGILGMKWGIRRYQNPDGTLTSEGRERYGVKTVEETKKLSYSKDYLTLKQKKNRTEKEEQKLKRLENGKKQFEKATKNPEYLDQLADDYRNHKNLYNIVCYQEYFDSTNYAKGMKKTEALMAIPTAIVGGAVDAGAIYAQFHFGSPIAFYGLATGLGASIGANIGSNMYEKKNLEDLRKELK